MPYTVGGVVPDVIKLRPESSGSEVLRIEQVITTTDFILSNGNEFLVCSIPRMMRCTGGRVKCSIRTKNCLHELEKSCLSELEKFCLSDFGYKDSNLNFSCM